MSEVVNFPTGQKTFTTAEDFAEFPEVRRDLVAVPGEERTERFASSCRSLEGEDCDLVLLRGLVLPMQDLRLQERHNKRERN